MTLFRINNKDYTFLQHFRQDYFGIFIFYSFKITQKAMCQKQNFGYPTWSVLSNSPFGKYQQLVKVFCSQHWRLFGGFLPILPSKRLLRDSETFHDIMQLYFSKYTFAHCGHIVAFKLCQSTGLMSKMQQAFLLFFCKRLTVNVVRTQERLSLDDSDMTVWYICAGVTAQKNSAPPP